MTTPAIAIPPEVATALSHGAPVAFGVSGGKDGSAAASATCRALAAMGHTGPRILIHSDLGRTEWAESLPICEALAARLGLELVVVRRQAGDMLDRWLTRWRNNVARYANLECVKLILPWSTAAMRFCTSELKTAIICRELVRRFPGHTILNVTGIRSQESPNRAKQPYAKPNNRLTSRTTTGLDWLPIKDWTLDQVWAEHKGADLPVHSGYTRWGVSRISCAFCILAGGDDLVRSAANPEHTPLYRAMVDLEITSTFSFQDSRWLADVAPHLLTDAQRGAVVGAKARAARRSAAEAQIPPHLRFTDGQPTVRPTWSEVILLADVRREVAAAVGLDVRYTSPEAVQARYEALMQGKQDASVTVQEALFSA
jgi:3'-phosphoadenosine 5'-phosphosulfate sulfotransferase (PAPS reductase)/FAD synthetase